MSSQYRMALTFVAPRADPEVTLSHKHRRSTLAAGDDQDSRSIEPKQTCSPWAKASQIVTGGSEGTRKAPSVELNRLRGP